MIQIMATDKASTRMSGEQMLSSAQMIAMAVSSAMSEQLPIIIDKIRDESTDRGGIKALHKSVMDLHSELKTQTVGINQQFDRVREKLSEGTTKMALHAQVLDQYGDRLDSLQDRVYNRSGNTSELQRALRARDPKTDRAEAPMINPKVWNVIVIAAITAVGTGVGTYVVDTFRAGQAATATQAAAAQAATATQAAAVHAPPKLAAQAP